jgi:NADPH:quinone reductase-like Zn-dependent oxidoreductase
MTPPTHLDDLTAPPGTPPGASTMRAVTQDRYGAAAEDVLRVAQIPRPTIGDGEVLLRVHAAAVDRGTWHIMAGLPHPLRLFGYGLRAPKDRVRGREVAGVVEQVGPAVTRLRVGDEVFGIAEGGFAEYAPAREDKLAHKPAGLSFEEAAATTISALTALQAVRDRGHVRPGQQVLIIGASGGVGTFAVQIAKSSGADVTGMCSTGKVDLVRALGADHVIDYTVDDIGTDVDGARQRYDVVLDIGGHRPLRQLRRALTPRGTLVIVGSETGGRWLGGFDRTIRALLLSPFLRQTLAPLVNKENAADLVVLADLVAAGTLRPVIDRSYPLEEAAAAIGRLQDGQARGKLVVRIHPPAPPGDPTAGPSAPVTAGR